MAPENLATWILSAIGAAGTVVAVFTVLAIRHEAVVARDIAAAANLNAQAVIASERPWFLVSIQPIGREHPGMFQVQAINSGRTPGRFENGDCVCKKHPADHKFSEKLNDPFLRPRQDLIVNSDSFPIRAIDP